MNAKISDVAERAGVSIKSVSRVLNNEPHVSEALRGRVQEAVAALGYVPSPTARALRSSRTYTIQFVTLSLRSNFHNEIQFGALRQGEAAGYRLVVSMLDPARADDRDYLLTWAAGVTSAGKPDGMILVPPMASDPVIGRIASDLGIPVVRIGPNKLRDEHATVQIDDRAAAARMTAHLAELGHDRIGFVLGKSDQDSAHERRAGYEAGMAAAGLDVDPALVLPGEFDFESGLAAGDRFLDMDDPPTAVFASNDDMAAGIVVAAHRRSIAVPGRLSVAGFDDTEIAEKMWPALTTVRQPLRELGGAAMRLLIGPEAGGPGDAADQRTLPFELVVRQSTGPCDAG